MLQIDLIPYLEANEGNEIGPFGRPISATQKKQTLCGTTPAVAVFFHQAP